MNDIPIHSANEETSLLASARNSKKRTPLPKRQISIVLLLDICEPIIIYSIYPYLNELIRELDVTGGNEKKVGYYAGLIISLFYASEGLTVLQWSRASDYVGRKPVLLTGLIATTLSMLSFGLSRTFWVLAVSRCLSGLLNGNIGVRKSVMGELTDSTNRAEGFALLQVLWGLGATIGPILGGSFSRPHERFPKYFGGSFWKAYPYFLPCLITSSFVVFVLVITLFFFKETITKSHSDDQLVEGQGATRTLPLDDPVPLRELLQVHPVVLSISNYAAMAFLNIALSALLPLFLAMPLHMGGLNFDPPVIGYIIGTDAAAAALLQAFCFARIVHYLGERKVIIYAVSLYIPIFFSFPLINAIALRFGHQSAPVWFFIVIVTAMSAFVDMAFIAVYMLVTSSAPNKRSLGATNGLSQTTVSIARAIGPALSTSLLSYSVEKNLLGGYAVYVIFATLSSFALRLATLLPEMVQDREDDHRF